MVFRYLITQLYTPFSACFVPDLSLQRLLIGELEKERMGRTFAFKTVKPIFHSMQKHLCGVLRLLRPPTQNIGLGI